MARLGPHGNARSTSGLPPASNIQKCIAQLSHLGRRKEPFEILVLNAHLLVQQAAGVVLGVVGAEGIGADQLRQAVDDADGAGGRVAHDPFRQSGAPTNNHHILA